jgi:16S rRNA (uracil1498-N3)-methyltransferase
VSASPGASPTGRDGPHAFVVDLDEPELDPDDLHHVSRALRLRPGEPMTVSDGSGAWRPVRFGEPLVVDGPIVRVARPEPPVTVAFALVKGTRPELVVQKLTEAGVDRVVLFEADRSVVRWDGAKVPRHLERLRQVARQAAVQSRRCVVPTVEVGVPFEEVAGLPGSVLADRGGRPLAVGDRLVLVGPEGGWTDAERSGRECVDLGPHVLRAETAAIAAGVLLTALRHQAVRHAT